MNSFQAIQVMIKQRLNSFKYAIAGIIELIRSQINMKLHIFAAMIVVLAGFYFSLSTSEWCIVILTIAAVFAAEAFNTALEFLTDLVSPDYHPLAGKTKDVAAGGVLICSIAAVIIGGLIFIPKILTLF